MPSENVKAIFLDRDGVINRERGDYTWLLEDFKLNDGLLEGLKQLKDLGFIFIVISNQSGIAKGLYSKEDTDYLHLQLERNLAMKDIHITEIYYCPHHPSVSNCICRKPDSLLIEKAIARFRINPAESWFIGDAERDLEAAQKAGVRGIRIVANSPLSQILPAITLQR